MRLKALIIYTSITGNTCQVASAMGETFQKYGISVDYAPILPKYKGGEIPTYYPEDYDIVCIGCPIIAALPYTNFNYCVGDQEDYKTRNVRFLRRENREDRHRYGIAFTTYGGTGNSPRECIATLEIEKSYLRTFGCTPVGEFACCGKELRHTSVDKLGDSLKINIPEAQALMSRFKENPEGEEFKKMAPEMIEKLKQLSSVSAEDSFGMKLFRDNDPLGIGKPGQANWHYNMQIRPHARDLQKARYFTENIIEDYFLTDSGAARPPHALYRSIC